MLPALYKHTEKLINIKTLAVVYTLSVMYQGYWWSIFIGYNFERLKAFLVTAFEATLLGKIVALLVIAILLTAAWTSLKLAVVAIRLARLASDPSARFSQSGKQKWHMLLGIGCVMVPLLTLIFLEPIKGEDGMILDTLAFIHYKAGNVKEALTLQEKAMTKLPVGTPDEIKKEMEERLTLYKSKQ